MPLQMVLSGQSTANWSCTTRVNSCVVTAKKSGLFADPVSQGNVVVARELARRHGDKIVSTSLHPGNIRTDLQRHFSGWQDALFVRSLIAFSGKIADSWTVLDIVPSIIWSTHIALLCDVTRCGGR